MHQILLIIFLSLTVITAESGSAIQVAKDIRLENLKRDHSGKFISFMNSDMETGQGILLDVTDKNIIISDDISMKALKFTTAINTEKAFKAGCNLVLHCNARMSEMTIVAKNSPKVDSFLLKKTLEFYKLVAI